MPRKPSIPSSASHGLTLIELLVAAAIAVILLGLAFQVVVSNRRIYTLDRARTAVNQNLRAALDLIGADVRQAGERLSADFPALEIIDHGQADELILRKGILDAVLPVCKDVSGNQDVIFINREGNAPHDNPACYRVDGNGNGWDDRQEAWQAFRCQQDGAPGCQNNDREVARAFLYDPVTGTGEWFTYDADDLSKFKVHKVSQPPWQYSYPANHRPRLYLVEEHRYTLDTSNGLLQLVKNGEVTNPLDLVDHVTAFSVEIDLQDGSHQTAFGTGDGWTQIKAVVVRIQAKEDYARGRTLVRTLEGRYLPRNVLSH